MVNNESGILISDVLVITNSLDIEGLLMTVDIAYKVFDCINYSFLMGVLKNSDLATNFKNGYKS